MVAGKRKAEPSPATPQSVDVVQPAKPPLAMTTELRCTPWAAAIKPYEDKAGTVRVTIDWKKTDCTGHAVLRDHSKLLAVDDTQIASLEHAQRLLKHAARATGTFKISVAFARANRHIAVPPSRQLKI